MSASDVELADVEVRRGGRPILRVERLIVERREFLGVVGPNGAGKTTLLEVCAALTPPTLGAAGILGRRVGDLSAWGRTRLRRRIGLVPQRAEYYPDVPLSVREVVALGCVGPLGLLGRWTSRDDGVVDEWIGRLGLGPLADRAFRSLSGGEQQKALIARAMAQEPALLLLDEPAAHLDLDWRERLVALLDELYRQSAVTIVMVSHDTELLPACVTRVVLMKAGGILRQGSPEEVLAPTYLAEAYGCPMTVLRLNGRFHAVATGPAAASPLAGGAP